MPAVVVLNFPLDVPAGNIFDLWDDVQALVERIHAQDGVEWSHVVTLAAGTRSFTVVLDPIDGFNDEPEAHRTITYYRTPRVADRVLCVSCMRGTLSAEVITIEDLAFEADDVPDEFLHG